MSSPPPKYIVPPLFGAHKEFLLGETQQAGDKAAYVKPRVDDRSCGETPPGDSPPTFTGGRILGGRRRK